MHACKGLWFRSILALASPHEMSRSHTKVPTGQRKFGAEVCRRQELLQGDCGAHWRGASSQRRPAARAEKSSKRRRRHSLAAGSAPQGMHHLPLHAGTNEEELLRCSDVISGRVGAYVLRCRSEMVPHLGGSVMRCSSRGRRCIQRNDTRLHLRMWR